MADITTVKNLYFLFVSCNFIPIFIISQSLEKGIPSLHEQFIFTTKNYICDYSYIRLWQIQPRELRFFWPTIGKICAKLGAFWHLL